MSCQGLLGPWCYLDIQWCQQLCICGTVTKINWDCVAGNICHCSLSNQPSEVPMVTGVELSVGLSMALLTLVFFLHSNATWSLHNLWQFMPQSAKGQKKARVRSQTGGKFNVSKLASTDVSLNTLSVLQMQFSERCVLTVRQTNDSHIFLRDGGGGKVWFWLQPDFFFFFFVLQGLARCVQHKKPHCTFFFFLKIASLYLLPTRHCGYFSSCLSMTQTDIWPNIDIPVLHKKKCNSYLCICSLAWWHPTTVVKDMERNTGEYQQAMARLKATACTVGEFVDCDLVIRPFLYFIEHHSWACVRTYKSWAVVTEGGFHVSCLLEVVDKTETQFGADDTGSHEIGCDLLSADEALPGQPQHIFTFSGLNVW